MKLTIAPATPHLIALAFDKFLVANPVNWPSILVEEMIYGVRERRITRWVALTGTFKVVAY